MRGILVKIGMFFEAHVEKVVLVLFGGLSLWLLFTWVAFSPNKVALDSQTLAPGKIDDTIGRNYTGDVEVVLASSPEEKRPYEPRFDGKVDPNNSVAELVRGNLDHGLMGLYSDVLAHLPQDAVPLPGSRGVLMGEGKGYQLPKVGIVTDLEVEHIRAAAYIPTESLTEELDYESVESEPNDLDLVTVQGRFDAGLLLARFYESFASEALPEDWRDPLIAKPVFAAVDLQRQELQPDGHWSQWKSLPRPCIDQYADLFNYVEDVDLLPPGGVRARMLRLDQDEVWLSLLQPAGYAFASAYEEWYPPALHQEYLEAREKEKLQERREERGDRDSTNGRGRGNDNDARGGDAGRGAGRTDRNARNRTNARGDRRGNQGGRGDARGVAGRTRDGQRGGEAGAYGRGGSNNITEMDKVANKLVELLIKPGTKVEDLDELVLWSHDDRVEPGRSYRYRLRLGVMNPVAGTNNICEDDLDLQTQAILWSEFSQPTEVIAIPQREYFFVRDYQESSGNISVEVAKFYLGYWRSEQFNVKPGELIGRVVEKAPEEEEQTRGRGGRDVVMGLGRVGQKEEVTSNPLEIDYSTNVFYVDAVRVEDWEFGVRMRPQIYYEALYSEDSETVKRMPVGSANWPSDFSSIYGIIKKAQHEDVEEFKGFDLGVIGTRGQTSGRGGRGVTTYGEG